MPRGNAILRQLCAKTLNSAKLPRKSIPWGAEFGQEQGVYRIRRAGLVTLAALGRRYPRTMRAVGGEHAMKSCQVDAGLRHQRDKSGHEVHRLGNHMFIPTEDDW